MSDRKLVSSKEGKGREVKYISQTYDIPLDVVKATIVLLSIDEGELDKQDPVHLETSRDIIYAALRVKGYTINVKPMTKKGKAAAKKLAKVNVDKRVNDPNFDNPY